MMRVPGSRRQPARRQGARRRRAFRLLAAGRAAGWPWTIPASRVVFFAVGFETTAPSTAVTLMRAREMGITNFSVFCNHVTIVPPIKAILDSPDLRLYGFIGPGHVSTVVGNRPYRFVPEVYGKPVVVAGFEPLDILAAVAMLLTQIREGRCEVENQYTPGRPGRRQPAGARAHGAGVRVAAAFRVARARLHLAERAEAQRRLRRFRRRSPLRHARRARRRPEGLPVR